MSQELPKFYDEFVRQYDRVLDGKKEKEYYAEGGHPSKLLEKVELDLAKLERGASFGFVCSSQISCRS